MFGKVPGQRRLFGEARTSLDGATASFFTFDAEGRNVRVVSNAFYQNTHGDII